MNDMLKTVLVLSLIAIIAGALLGLVNEVTFMSDEEVLANKLSEAYEADSFKHVKDLDKYLTTTISSASSTDATEKKRSLRELLVGSEESAGASLDGIYLPEKDGAVVPDVYIYSVSSKGFGGVIKLLIVVENNKITNVVKMEAAETAGLGDNGFKDKFLDQFKSLDLSKGVQYRLASEAKADGDVVKISGASITSNAMLSMFNLVQGVHQNVLEKGV